MKTKIRTLVELQDTEVEIHRVERTLAAAPERFETLTAEGRALTEVVQAAAAHSERLNKRYRELEQEARRRQDSTAERSARLHEVKTNKEYQARLKEIEDLEALVSGLEDEMLALLEAIEAADAELRKRKEECAERNRALAEEVAAVERSMIRERERLEALRLRREEIAARVDPALMPVYRKARVQQGDQQAVAGVVDAVCQGCHMNIPPQLYNELQRRDELKICPLCQRIIYWKPEV